MQKTLNITTYLLLGVLAGLGPGAAGQVQPRPQAPENAQPVQANLNLIIAQVQKATLATNGDLGKLRIEKWKTDGEQRDQLQKMADSIQRNITYAVPGLIADIQNSHGSMATTFKLYHNITIVYEYLTSLTEAAGVLGKKEEYEPLAADAAALDSARQNLSTYIEQTASTIESRGRPNSSAGAAPARPGGSDGVKRIVVDDLPEKPVKPTKKKSSKPAPASSPTPH